MKSNKKILFAAWSSSRDDYYAYQTWYKPLSNLFSTIITFDPQKEMYDNGKDVMNKKFLEMIEKEKPDYVFLWLIYDEFYISTLKKIKEISPKTKIINFCGDDDTLFYNYSLFYSLFIDYSLIAHKEFIKKYKNKAFLSLGVDAEVFKHCNEEKIYPVTFLGTPKVDRFDYLKFLIANDVDLKIFGSGWSSFEEMKNNYLLSKNYPEIINKSKINLCFTKNYLKEKHVNQHFFEVSACKAFSLVEYSKGYLDYFKEGKEIIMFKNKEDLLKKINYYLKNEKEREKIAEASYLITKNKFSKDKEFEEIFNCINASTKFRKKLNLLSPKVLELKEKEIFSEKKYLKEKISSVDYVSLGNKGSENLPYRYSLQSYGLEETNKPISCCDFYVYSKKLGDFMLFTSKFAFNLLNSEDFNSIIVPEQLLIEKNFFLEKLSIFQNFFLGKKTDLFNEKNISFVSIPLVRIRKSKEIKYKEMKKVFLLNFVNDLRAKMHKGKIHFFIHLIKIGLHGLKQPFIIKYFFDNLLRFIKIKKN